MSLTRSFLFRAARWGRCVALWFILVLPLSPSIWRLYTMGPTCFTPAWAGTGMLNCLTGFALFAPFAVIFGPLGHDEDLAPSELPEVLGTALFLALVLTGLSFILRNLRNTHSGPAVGEHR